MLVNRKEGDMCCPFCGEPEPEIEYSCNTSGREWGTIDKYLDTDCCDGETTDTYDFDYEMRCCHQGVGYDDIQNILEGSYCMDHEPDEGWDDDEEGESSDIIQDPIKALFKHLTK